jgi:hypothetical protein
MDGKCDVDGTAKEINDCEAKRCDMGLARVTRLAIHTQAGKVSGRRDDGVGIEVFENGNQVIVLKITD